MLTSQGGKKDYYQVLGIPRTASQDQIETAYRDLARRWHPDVREQVGHGDAEFKAISEAYEVLADPEKRRRYDQQRGGTRVPLSASPRQSPSAPAGRRDVAFDYPWGVSSFAGAACDLFQSALGAVWQDVAAGGTQPVSRHLDLEAELFVTPEEAFHGTVCDVTLSYREPCPACSGKAGPLESPCESCQGETSIRRPLGPLSVRVPPGVRNGSIIRVSGAGKPAAGSAYRGDLRLRVRIRPCW